MRGRLGRLKRNVHHNRFFLFFGGTIYVRALAPKRLVPLGLAENLSSEPRVYVRLGSLLAFEPLSKSQIGLSVPHLGMLGNAFAAFVPPLARGISVGVEHFVIHGETVLSHVDDFGAKGAHRLEKPKVTLWLDCEPERSSNPIVCLISYKSIRGEISDLDADATWNALAEVLNVPPSEEGLGEKTLVIHLRGGDAYGGNRALLNHGQPPLSYYLEVLQHRSWREVVIVHQGTKMPVLLPLIQHCETLAIPLRLQAGSLREDVDTILKAEVLVAGRGSFIPQLAGLSSCLREIYTYESGFGMAIPKKNVQTWTVSDKTGAYRQEILSNNWRNTQAQRRLMIEYPAENLVLTGPRHM